MPTFNDCLTESKQIGERNDCTVKAIAIAGGFPYLQVHEVLALNGRYRGHGCPRSVWEASMTQLGLTWTETRPRQPSGSRYTMKTIARAFPRGRHIVQVNGHVAALVDGKVEDWTDGRQYRVHRVLSINGAEPVPAPVVQPRTRSRSKNLNPQPVINYKRAVVEAAGGKLIYAERKWTLVSKDGEVLLQMTSREFSLTEASTLAQIVIERS